MQPEHIKFTHRLEPLSSMIIFLLTLATMALLTGILAANPTTVPAVTRTRYFKRYTFFTAKFRNPTAFMIPISRYSSSMVNTSVKRSTRRAMRIRQIPTRIKSAAMIISKE